MKIYDMNIIDTYAISKIGRNVKEVPMTLSKPLPRYRVLPKSFLDKGISNLDMLIKVHIPLRISVRLVHDDISYWQGNNKQ